MLSIAVLMVLVLQGLSLINSQTSCPDPCPTASCSPPRGCLYSVDISSFDICGCPISCGTLSCDSVLNNPVAPAGFVEILAHKDTSIFETYDTNSGAGDLFIGTSTDGNRVRTLIKFDLSAIPSNGEIDSCSLNMEVTYVSPTLLDPSNADKGHTVYAYRISKTWGEGLGSNLGPTGAPSGLADATWNAAMTQLVNWTSPGGDFIAPYDFKFRVEPVLGIQSFVIPPASCQDLVDHPASNFGWILLGSRTLDSIRMFASRESFSPPSLQLHFTAGVSSTGTTSSASSTTNSVASTSTVSTTAPSSTSTASTSTSSIASTSVFSSSTGGIDPTVPVEIQWASLPALLSQFSRTVFVGQPVIWIIVDDNIHTVTDGVWGDPNAGALFDAIIVGNLSTFTYTFKTTGVYPYFCRPHFKAMYGNITVIPVPTTQSMSTTSKASTTQLPSTSTSTATTSTTSTVAPKNAVILWGLNQPSSSFNVTIFEGQSVTWKRKGTGGSLTVTSGKRGSSNTGDRFNILLSSVGDSFTYTFKSKGYYFYHSIGNPTLEGLIIVKKAPTTTPSPSTSSSSPTTPLITTEIPTSSNPDMTYDAAFYPAFGEVVAPDQYSMTLRFANSIFTPQSIIGVPVTYLSTEHSISDAHTSCKTSCRQSWNCTAFTFETLKDGYECTLLSFPGNPTSSGGKTILSEIERGTVCLANSVEDSGRYCNCELLMPNCYRCLLGTHQPLNSCLLCGGGKYMASNNRCVSTCPVGTSPVGTSDLGRYCA